MSPIAWSKPGPHVPHVLSEEGIEELRLCGLYPNAADLLCTLDAACAYAQHCQDAANQGFEAVARLIEGHPEISAWPEWDALSRFVHDNAALAKNPGSAVTGHIQTGWRLVPVKATDAMWVAGGNEVFRQYHESTWDDAKDVAENLNVAPIWTAMLAVAPTTPSSWPVTKEEK